MPGGRPRRAAAAKAAAALAARAEECSAEEPCARADEGLEDTSASVVQDSEEESNESENLARKVEAIRKKGKARSWDENYLVLKHYKEQHGNCNVPWDYKKDPSLGYFVQKARAEGRRTMSASLEQEQQESKVDGQRSNVVSASEKTSSSAGEEDEDEDEDLARKVEAIRKKDTRNWDDNYIVLSLYKKQHGNCNVPWEYKEDPSLSYYVHKVRSEGRSCKLKPGQRERLDRLGFCFETMTEKYERVWNDYFESLKAYRRLHGHCYVPLKANTPLAKWITTQRSSYRKGILPPDREAKLDSIHFAWTLAEECNRMRSDSNKGCPVENQPVSPLRNDIMQEDSQVSRKQRALENGPTTTEDAASVDDSAGESKHHRGRPCKKRVRQGDDSENPAKRRATTRTSTKGTIAKPGSTTVSKEGQGRTNLPETSTTEPSFAGKKQQAMLTQEQKKKLDEIGFSWETRTEKLDREWNEKFQLLKKYWRENGDCNVTAKTSRKLNQWVCVQRERKKEGKLRRDREAKLRSIHFTWRLGEYTGDKTLHDGTWLDMYDKMKDYKEEHGHTMVPKTHHDQKFARWTVIQRSKHNKGQLREDRTQMLDSIGFVWSVDPVTVAAARVERTWERRFDRLVAYKNEFGHANAPDSGETGNIGAWLAQQHKMSENGTLGQDKLERLSKLGVVWAKKRARRSRNDRRHSI